MDSVGSVGSGSSTITPMTYLANLGGRTMIDGQPVHAASQGSNEGGGRAITKIVEEK